MSTGFGPQPAVIFGSQPAKQVRIQILRPALMKAHAAALQFFDELEREYARDPRLRALVGDATRLRAWAAVETYAYLLTLADLK